MLVWVGIIAQFVFDVELFGCLELKLTPKFHLLVRTVAGDSFDSSERQDSHALCDMQGSRRIVSAFFVAPSPRSMECLFLSMCSGNQLRQCRMGDLLTLLEGLTHRR